MKDGAEPAAAPRSLPQLCGLRGRIGSRAVSPHGAIDEPE